MQLRKCKVCCLLVEILFLTTQMGQFFQCQMSMNCEVLQLEFGFSYLGQILRLEQFQNLHNVNFVCPMKSYLEIVFVLDNFVFVVL